MIVFKAYSMREFIAAIIHYWGQEPETKYLIDPGDNTLYIILLNGH